MKFDLKKQVVVITGGAGNLGFRYAKAIAENNGIPVIIDIDGKKVKENPISAKHPCTFFQDHHGSASSKTTSI